MQTDEITKQLTAFATHYGYKLKACASPSHWQLTMRNCKFNVHYGRKGFCVVEAHGLCNIRTATLRELAGHILAITLQQGGDNQSETKATTTETDAAVRGFPAGVVTVVRDTVSRRIAVYVGGNLLRTDSYLCSYAGEPPMSVTMETALKVYGEFPKQLCDVKPLAYVVFDRAGETKPAVAETPCASAKTTSREWATAFVEKHKRFPHALDYANAGYDKGTQCDCRSLGDCVLRDAFNGQHCDRNCYTDQLRDYIAMSNTKRAEPKQEDRPATVEELLSRISKLESQCRNNGKSPTTVYIPSWAESLLLCGIHLPEVRTTMKWRAHDWRPYSIYSLACVWGSDEFLLSVE